MFHIISIHRYVQGKHANSLQIVKIASAAIPENRQSRPVERVNIRVGKLTAVVPESRGFCFDIIAKETQLSGAQLVIEAVPARGRCQACDFERQITDPVFLCQKCRSGSIDIVSGRELEVVSIEISQTSKGPENAGR